MNKMKEPTYTIKEVRENLDRYLDASVDRLRMRLKSAWKKQVSGNLRAYDKAKI